MTELKKTKVVSIDDLSGKKWFTIRALNVYEGIEIMDKLAGSIQDFATGKHFSIKEYLTDLIPLAIPMDENGVKIVWDGTFTVEDAKSMFESPLSLIDLAWEVLDHQKSFFKDSKSFQKLNKKVNDLLHTQK